MVRHDDPADDPAPELLPTTLATTHTTSAITNAASTIRHRLARTVRTGNAGQLVAQHLQRPQRGQQVGEAERQTEAEHAPAVDEQQTPGRC